VIPNGWLLYRKDGPARGYEPAKLLREAIFFAPPGTNGPLAIYRYWPGFWGTGTDLSASFSYLI
jgi:hypothetical protein